MAFAPQPEVQTSEKKRKCASPGPRARLPDSPNALPTALCGVGLNRTRAGRAEGAIPMPGAVRACDTHRSEPEWRAVLRTTKAGQATAPRSCSSLRVGVRKPNTDTERRAADAYRAAQARAIAAHSRTPRPGKINKYKCFLLNHYMAITWYLKLRQPTFVECSLSSCCGATGVIPVPRARCGRLCMWDSHPTVFFD